ncbi:Substance-K receptor [Ophiophagus hannah]|uniref:Substance-K receptor n=1 Tax=Ophiophagus hannah TaxID=8665 RepID=V8NZD9_OPHHA|nr:Substance-K receptor [Ophiophagus hannah]
MVSFSSINNTSQDWIFENDVNLTEMTTFYQPGWQIALWAIAYLLIITASIVGNATIIWIILSHRQMRTVTNYFIVNLALSDLLMSALNTVFNFVYACHNVWYFGEGFCRFHNFVPVTAMFVSIYSMTAVSMERYMAIVYPFKQKLSAANTKWIIGIIWLVACALAFPQFFYAQVITDHGLAKCAVNWPHNHSQRQQLTYHITVILLIYVLPLTVMFVTYSAIGITLWHNDVPGDHATMVYYQHKIVAKKKIFIFVPLAGSDLDSGLLFNGVPASKLQKETGLTSAILTLTENPKRTSIQLLYEFSNKHPK